MGVPAPRLKRTLRPRDFLLHQEYVLHERQAEQEREWGEYHREDYYSAQIAYGIYLLRWSVDHIFAERRSQPELGLDAFFFKPESDRKKEAEPQVDYLNKVVVKSAMDSAAVAMCLGTRVPKGG